MPNDVLSLFGGPITGQAGLGPTIALVPSVNPPILGGWPPSLVNLALVYATSWNQQFSLVADITNLTFAFTIRQKFRGIILLQKTTGNGIANSAGLSGIWTLSLSKSDLTTWVTGINVQPGKYWWDMQVTNVGYEMVTHYGQLQVRSSYRSS